MRLRSALCHVLALLAVVGILLAPVAAPARAGVPAPASMVAADEGAMPDDMPCCPKQQLPDWMKACPLLAACLSQCFQIPGSENVLPSLVLAAVIVPQDEATPAGLAQPPPARPPRSIA